MKVIKCDICGAICENMDDLREVQIRKRKNMYDNRPILEKTYDICLHCVKRFLDSGREE